MGIFSNHKFACTVMIVLIIGSFFLGSSRSLHSLTQEAETIFYEGSRGDGIGIYYDIEANKGIASNVLTIANRYITNEEDPALIRLQKDLDALKAAKTPAQLYEQNQAVTQSVIEICGLLTNMEIEDRDYNYCLSLPLDMDENNRRMSRDAYNDAAREVNAKLTVLPADVLKNVVGVKELHIFE